ncbi:MAG: PAS domain-containing protein [Actinoplanes sp.]
MSTAVEWILLGSASCSAIFWGVWRHRPAHVRPWLLLAAAVFCMAVGDVLYDYRLLDFADAFYLAMFPLVVGTLLQFTRGGSLLIDRAHLIDLLACVCSVLLVVWVFVIGGAGRIGTISAADVLGNLMLVGFALKVVIATSGRNLSAILLLTGSVGMLAGDALYPTWPGGLTESCYVVLYVCWGLAALHPSMTALTQPIPARPTPWKRYRAVLLGAAVGTPPLVLLIEALSAQVNDGVVIAVAAGITLVLTITRLADSVTLSNQALMRERALREASADLVVAADSPSVDQAVRTAVTKLLPVPAVSKVIFATDDRQLAAEELPPAPVGPGSRSWWTGESADGEEATLVCPLWLEPLAVARPNGGALVLTGRRSALLLARDALEVLAGQATLALDRIGLVEAIGRRDSDLYLRAVIRNTADLMLVVDEDQRIRYASPALQEMLGDDQLSPLATLQDLVHADDRGQVRRALDTGGDGTLFCALRRSDESQVLIEATYRDLREDRLVQGFVLTMRNVTSGHDPVEQLPHRDHVDELPAWVNRRSAQHKFRY